MQNTSRSGFFEAIKGHRSLWNLSSLTWFLAINSQRLTARNSILGHSWWVIEPVMQIALFFVSFGIMLKTGTENYFSMLICGVVTWRFFSQAVSMGANSLMQNQAFLLSFKVSSAVFPLAACLDAAVRVVPMAVAMLAYAAYASGVGWNWLWLPLIALVQITMVLAIVIHLSWIMIYLPDLNQIVDVALRAGLFLSGVFYVASELGRRGEILMAVNPEALIIQSVRDVLVGGHMPNLLGLACVLGVSVMALAVGVVVHKGKSGRLPALLMN